MKILSKSLIFVLFISLFVGFTGSAQAYNPTLNVYSSGSGSTTISINGGQPNSTVVINYTPSGSNLSASVSGTTDYNGTFTTMINGSQISATVGGQQVYDNNNGYNGGCTYNCGSPYGLSLSQTSLSLNVGQSASVSATYPYSVYGSTNNIYVSGNSNSGVASAQVSGNQITVYGVASGSATISVCGNSNSSTCASLYVTVSGSNCTYSGCNVGGLTLSQTSLNLNVGQSATVTASMPVYNPSFYISSNSNSYVASASVSGNQINVYGLASGSTNISVCSSSSVCTTLYVTVGGGGNSSSVTFSPTSVNLAVGQSSSVFINAGYLGSSLYISNNSNSSVVSASISGSTLYLQAGNIGSSTITVCQNSSACGYLYVTVGGTGGNGSISLSQTSLSLNVGQSSTISVYNNGNSNGSYYVSGNSNSNVASASISGSSLYVNALSAGSTSIIVCQSSYSSSCATLYVTVSGVLGANTNLWFSPSNPNLYVGQSLAVSINSSAYSTAYPYNNSAYSISSNSNSNVVSANVSGTALNLYANQNGSSNITVCSSALGFCGTLYVTVGGGSSYGNGSIILSQTTLGLNVGQSSTVNVSGNGGYGYYISNNSNPGVVSASFNGSVLTVYAISNGSSALQICQNNANSCPSLYVTVGNGYSYGGGGVAYPRGNVLGTNTYQNGQLISEGSTVYIVYKNTKIGFSNSSAFLGLGFGFGNVLAVGNSGLTASSYTVTTSAGQHPWGSWIKSGQTVYFVHQSGLIPVPDWNTFLSNGGQASFIVSASIYDFRQPMLSPMTSGDSRLQ
jgi:hypothetical protein